MSCFQIEWNNIPHTEIALPQGKWKFPEGSDFGAMIFQIVHTAREMGLTLSEFLALPDDEKALQMAFSNITSKMEAVNQQDAADRMAKNKPKAKR